MKETKIIQVYPSDYAIQSAIEEWESFGWELTDNQKFSDKEDLWYPGGTTVRTTTYNKLTFSREKSSPWYGEIVELERQYISCINLKPIDRSVKPSKIWLLPGILFVVLGAMLMFLMIAVEMPTSALTPGLLLIGLGAILLTVYIIKKVKYKKLHQGYEDELRIWKKTSKIEADELRRKAINIINAY